MDLSNTTPAEAEQIWNSLAAEREQGNGPTASGSPAADAQHAQDAGAVPSDTTTEDAAARQNADQSQQESAAATAQAAAAKDPIAELVERFAKVEQQLRGVHGHIGGLAQGQQQLREQMLTAAKQATAQAGGEAPTQAQAKDAMSDPEKWKALKGDFPEWGDAVESLLDARLGAGQKVDQSAIDRMVEERVATESAKVRDEAVNAHLDTVVDGSWKAVVKSEDFGKWLQGQPDDVKALGESAALTDASKMLRLFVKSKDANPADQIRQTRNSKLDAAAAVPQAGRRVPIRKSEADMGPEELWDHHARQRDKQRG